MADEEVEVDEEAPAPEPEPTPEEKLGMLKDALAEGHMGPAQFDSEHQTIWMKIKGDEGMPSLSGRNNRGSMQITRAVPQEDE